MPFKSFWWMEFVCRNEAVNIRSTFFFQEMGHCWNYSVPFLVNSRCALVWWVVFVHTEICVCNRSYLCQFASSDCSPFSPVLVGLFHRISGSTEDNQEVVGRREWAADGCAQDTEWVELGGVRDYCGWCCSCYRDPDQEERQQERQVSKW